ncbi:MAG: DUF2117 domain-containing protein [Euryarchaeota archaeon]|nr:DUF2117 domain-containing protein [Euryarchaeota archaeon]
MKPDIGVVIHGPEVIDSGGARHVLDVLQEHYTVTAMLGGTMGRTAVLDARLEDEIDISRRMALSDTIDLLSWTDAVILLSRGKSIDSGIAFGRITVSRAKKIPVIQIESQTRNSVVIPWNGATEWAEAIAGIMDLPIRTPPPAQNVRLAYTADGLTHRRIHNVMPGETIRINGIVVGTAVSGDVEIVVDDFRVVAITGTRIKEHGIEKLRRIDLKSALVRTGSIRRTQHEARVGRVDAKEKIGDLRVVLIDHDAESTFELSEGADIAVTVGDDTTAIAGDILYRLGIPVIGITDMDLDDVLSNTNILPGSAILRVKPGYDDVIGALVRDRLFGGTGQMVARSFESVREQVVGIAGARLIEVLEY